MKVQCEGLVLTIRGDLSIVRCLASLKSLGRKDNMEFSRVIWAIDISSPEVNEQHELTTLQTQQLQKFLLSYTGVFAKCALFPPPRIDHAIVMQLGEDPQGETLSVRLPPEIWDGTIGASNAGSRCYPTVLKSFF